MLEKIKIVDKVSLKELRKLCGMSTVDFADYCDIPISTYRRYERVPDSISLKKATQICNKVGVDISVLKA